MAKSGKILFNTSWEAVLARHLVRGLSEGERVDRMRIEAEEARIEMESHFTGWDLELEPFEDSKPNSLMRVDEVSDDGQDETDALAEWLQELVDEKYVTIPEYGPILDVMSEGQLQMALELSRPSIRSWDALMVLLDDLLLLANSVQPMNDIDFGVAGFRGRGAAADGGIGTDGRICCAHVQAGVASPSTLYFVAHELAHVIAWYRTSLDVDHESPYPSILKDELLPKITTAGIINRATKLLKSGAKRSGWTAYRTTSGKGMMYETERWGIAVRDNGAFNGRWCKKGIKRWGQGTRDPQRSEEAFKDIWSGRSRRGQDLEQRFDQK